MTLNEWAAKTKRSIFDELSRGAQPSQGEFDAVVLKEAMAKGKPQMGSTVYAPDQARFEFVYADAGGTTVFSVALATPERVVFLPVPKWVVETIWQGDVDGSYHFESHARSLVDDFVNQLTPAANPAHFAPKQATRRE